MAIYSTAKQAKWSFLPPSAMMSTTLSFPQFVLVTAAIGRPLFHGQDSTLFVATGALPGVNQEGVNAFYQQQQRQPWSPHQILRLSLNNPDPKLVSVLHFTNVSIFIMLLILPRLKYLISPALSTTLLWLCLCLNSL